MHIHIDTSQLKTMFCCQLLFVSFLQILAHTGHIYKAGRVPFVCIGANKGLHHFSMKKVVILIFFLLEHCSSLVTGLLT